MTYTLFRIDFNLRKRRCNMVLHAVLIPCHSECLLVKRTANDVDSMLGLNLSKMLLDETIDVAVMETNCTGLARVLPHILNYVKAHPDQDASAALIALLEDDTESIEAAAALLTDRARGSVAANLYKSNLEAAQKEAEEEARQEAMAGNPAPDFTLNDINGKPLALSSLRGKWVIIDFWGSWCKWCIKGIPDMKEYYTKYGDKLEILGVDCNDTVEKWKAAVKEYELPWVHVYWDKDDENGDNPLELYGVRGFPTKVVVDPKGNVAKVIVGEDPAFYDYLDEVLK